MVFSAGTTGTPPRAAAAATPLPRAPSAKNLGGDDAAEAAPQGEAEAKPFLAFAPGKLCPNPNDLKLLEAVQAGDVAKATAVLAVARKPSRPDPNVVSLDFSAQPVLIIAAKAGLAPVVQLLLAAGAAVDKTDATSCTALHAAADAASAECVQLLLAAGAAVNAADAAGRTPLHVLCTNALWSFGHPDAVAATAKALLASGADVMAQSGGFSGTTPAKIAETIFGDVHEEGLKAPIRAAVAAAAVTAAALEQRKTALRSACDNCDAAALSALLAGDDGAAVAAAAGGNALFHMVARCTADPTPDAAATVVKALKGACVAIDGLDASGITALHCAVARNNQVIAAALLSAGADAAAPDADGITPLHLAACEGSTDMVSLLLERSAGRASELLFVSDKLGRTPLHAAAAAGSARCVTLLCGAGGAAVAAADESGVLPLHAAARAGHADVVRILARVGADLAAPALRMRNNVARRDELASESQASQAALSDSARRAGSAHPGSWSGCGGNPMGVAQCTGSGNCGRGCVACGAGTHWSCCASQAKLSDSCSLMGSLAPDASQARTNADSCFTRAHAPCRVDALPGVHYPSSGDKGNTADEAVGESGLPAVGARVRLAEGYAALGDAAEGPMAAGDVGVVMDVIADEGLATVRAPDGRTWDYLPAALEVYGSQPQRTRPTASGGLGIFGGANASKDGDEFPVAGVTYTHGPWRLARVCREGRSDELVAWRTGAEPFALRLDVATGETRTGAAIPGMLWDGRTEWLLPLAMWAWSSSATSPDAEPVGLRPAYAEIQTLSDEPGRRTVPLPLQPWVFGRFRVTPAAQTDRAAISAAAAGMPPPLCFSDERAFSGSKATLMRIETVAAVGAAVTLFSKGRSQGMRSKLPDAASDGANEDDTLSDAPSGGPSGFDGICVGQRVCLAPGWAGVSDAARGPLQAMDEVGKVTAVDIRGGLLVEFNGFKWLYQRGSLKRFVDNKTAELRLGDRVVLSPMPPDASPVAWPPPGGSLKDGASIGVVTSLSAPSSGAVSVQVRGEDGAMWWYPLTQVMHAPAALAPVPLHVARSVTRQPSGALGAACSYAEWTTAATRVSPAPSLGPTPSALARVALAPVPRGPPKSYDAARDADLAIHVAAAGGHVDALRVLLEAGAHPGAWGAGGRCALHAAAAADSTACVAILLAAGADANVTAAAGGKATPLHAAAAAGALGAMQALLEAGAGLTAADAAGATPRDVAKGNAARRMLDTAASVAKAAADAAAASTEALFVAAGVDDVASVRAAFQERGAPAVLRLRRAVLKAPLLHAACSSGAGAVAALLVEAGAQVSDVDEAGNTALHCAVAAPQAAAAAELTEKLIALGAVVDEPNAKGHTPLHVAARQARPAEAIVRALLAAGAEASTPTTHGKATPAHFAAAAGQKEALLALLARGAELEASDANGATPMHAAAASHAPGAASCVAELLTARASPLRRDAAGRTPVDVALKDAVKQQLGDAAKEAARTDPAARWAAEAGRADFVPVPAIDTLMKLTGLSGVKHAVLSMYFQVRVIAQRNKLNGTTASVLSEATLHMRFDGNPGTGKTTVARLVGAALYQMGVMETPAFMELGGAAVLSGGLDTFKLQTFANPMGELKDGGVLFIDEAYQLNPKTDQSGAQIVNYLLKEVEDRRGNLVCILAGYMDQMDEFFTFNPGLPSRFPHHFTFEDFEYSELLDIFRNLLAEKRFKAESPKAVRIAVRRIATGRGTPGFGNARAVRTYVEAAVRRQQDRLGRDGAPLDKSLNILTRADLLGPCQIPEKLPAVLELESMVGLEGVKKQVRSLLAIMKDNIRREDNEEPPKRLSLNRLFLGNPGTGKTTVAKLYGRILKEMGWLSRGDTVVKVPADFMGSVIGESERRTLDILTAARGKVLVIDEAYGLGDKSSYMESVVTTIVAKVQAEPGDDIAVLLLGYTDDMQEMLRTANGGLARRFRSDDAFIFDDYDNDALRFIMLAKAKSRELDIPSEAADVAIAMLARQRQKPRFGNGGAIENLLSRALESQSRRIQEAEDAGEQIEDAQRRTLLAVDFDREPPEDPEAALAHLVGADLARAKLQELRATVAAAQASGTDPWAMVEGCFVLKGPPGCGKTTLARALGQMFYSLGLLAEPDVVEKTASTLQTGYFGQAGLKVRSVMDEALGKVLFIDEAYMLGGSSSSRRHSYSDEIVNELVACLTDAKYKSKMIVIMAGYTDEMTAFMANANPGLRSRFSQELVLEPFTAELATQVGVQRVAALNMSLSPGGMAAMQHAFAAMAALPSWASGRTVETLVKNAARKVSLRAHGGTAALGTVAVMDAEDVKAAAAEMEASDDSGATARMALRASGFFRNTDSSDNSFDGGSVNSRPPVRPSGGGSGGSSSGMATATATNSAAREEEHTSNNSSGASPPDLWTHLERACVQCSLSASDIKADLEAHRVPDRVVNLVAAKLACSAADARDMLVSQAPALLTRIKKALEEAERIEDQQDEETEGRNRQWICSFCHNSNPECPYRAQQEGGYYADV